MQKEEALARYLWTIITTATFWTSETWTTLSKTFKIKEIKCCSMWHCVFISYSRKILFRVEAKCPSFNISRFLFQQTQFSTTEHNFFSHFIAVLFWVQTWLQNSPIQRASSPSSTIISPPPSPPPPYTIHISLFYP